MKNEVEPNFQGRQKTRHAILSHSIRHHEESDQDQYLQSKPTRINIRSRPGKPNQRKGRNEKFMNFAHFCENSGVFP